jgi:hypothetical protein
MTSTKLIILTILILGVTIGIGVVVRQLPSGYDTNTVLPRRQAQALCSVHSAGRAVGVEWMAPNLDELLAKMKLGVVCKVGEWKGSIFQYPTGGENLFDTERTRRYLRFDQTTGELVFVDEAEKQ